MPERKRIQHPGGGESMTKQADANAADANVLVRRWVQGEPVYGAQRPPEYGDFSDGLSYHECMNRVRQAELDFMSLPAPVRRLCDNDAGRFLDIVHSSEGRAFLEGAGLLPATAPKTAPDASPDVPDQLPLTSPPEDVPQGD